MIELEKILFELENCANSPKKTIEGDAGYDLSTKSIEQVLLLPYEQTIINTGVIVAIPKGYVGLVSVRSSFAKLGLHVTLGIIDAGYRNTVKVLVRNLSNTELVIGCNTRFAQLIIIPICHMECEIVPNIDKNTERGLGGFGSTGK